jgi:hypothetical protein
MRLLIAVGVLAGAALAQPVLAGVEEPEAGPRGARFTLTASSTVARANGNGVLDPQAPKGGSGRIRVRTLGAARQTVVLSVGRWDLDYVDSTMPVNSTSTLVLRVAVASTTDARRCAVGARGTVTLVDSGAGDSAAVTFARGRCKPFARAFSTEGGDDVNLTISLIGG